MNICSLFSEQPSSNLHTVSESHQPTCVVIGNFDGVHLGHQALFVLAQAHFPHLPIVALTFEPHPREVLGGKPMPRLVDAARREALLRQAGAARVDVVSFTRDLAALPPETFVREVLLERLHMQQLVMGYDFHMGKERHGSGDVLRDLGMHWGFGVEQCDPFRVRGEVVSSSRIRKFLEEGRVDTAAAMLGREHRVCGVVTPGFQRGRLMGFPTANLSEDMQGAPLGVMLPKVGAYAVWAGVEGEAAGPAVANVGCNPTFGPGALRVEVHLLDRHFGLNELYEKRVCVDFVHRLRDEQTFSSADALAVQLQTDVVMARQLLRHTPLRAKNHAIA